MSHSPESAVPVELHPDFRQAVVVDSEHLPWAPSPSASVWRRRLELQGTREAGRVTSVVRYEPHSHFPSHPHPEGEEIVVLDGVFSDETGDYGRGSFLLNPEGFQHAPYSESGCTLLVKLRQSPGARQQVCTRFPPLDSERWALAHAAGLRVCTLYEQAHFPERIALYRADSGTSWQWPLAWQGVEVFVLEGGFAESNGTTHRQGAWLRQPHGACRELHAPGGCLLYVKSNHLGQEALAQSEVLRRRAEHTRSLNV